jgi:hypothetical protein
MRQLSALVRGAEWLFLMATSSLAQAQSSGLRHLAKFAAKTALSDDIEEAWPRIYWGVH